MESPPVNCRHSFSAFYPNIQLDPEPQIDYEASKKKYQQEQYARGLERAIRKTKRIIAGLKESGLTHIPEVKAQLEMAEATLKRQLDNYYEYCSAHRINADGSRLVVSESTDIGN